MFSYLCGLIIYMHAVFLSFETLVLNAEKIFELKLDTKSIAILIFL